MTYEQIEELFNRYIAGILASNILIFILLLFITLIVFFNYCDKSQEIKEKQNRKDIENTIKEYLSKNGK